MQDHFKFAHRDDSVDSGLDMDSWVLKMLVGQVKDEFKAVVKTALTILEEAYSVPVSIAYIEFKNNSLFNYILIISQYFIFFFSGLFRKVNVVKGRASAKLSFG